MQNFRQAVIHHFSIHEALWYFVNEFGLDRGSVI